MYDELNSLVPSREEEEEEKKEEEEKVKEKEKVKKKSQASRNFAKNFGYFFAQFYNDNLRRNAILSSLYRVWAIQSAPVLLPLTRVLLNIERVVR